MHRKLASVLLLLLFAQLAFAAFQLSPTCDEPAHLAAGLYTLDTGRFDVYRVNPPLVRTVAAAAAAVLRPNRDYGSYDSHPRTRAEWALGRDLVSSNADHWEWYFPVARLAVIPFTIIGALAAFWWSRELYGLPKCYGVGARHYGCNAELTASAGPGLVALCLYVFCPNLVAWGATITPDAATGALGVIATYTFWKWLRDATWHRAFFAGLSLGFAEIAKFSWAILVPLWIALWILWRYSGRRVRRRDSASKAVCERAVSRGDPPPHQLLCIIGLATCVLNMGYAFEGTFTPLREFSFVSSTLTGGNADRQGVGNRFDNSIVGVFPVPLPANYIRGIDLQKAEFEDGKVSYLNGEWAPRGWWYYYVYAAVLKIPLGTWALALTVMAHKVCRARGDLCDTTCQPHKPVMMLAGNATWLDEVVLLSPGIALFVLVSSQTGFSRYFRYVVPCLPFVYIWIGQAALYIKWNGNWAHRALSAGIVAAIAWSAASSVSVFPHSISFFNEAAGGPGGGHRYLVDANIDWGQDMYYLRKWAEGHSEATPLYVSAFSPIQPKYYGIAAMRPPPTLEPGWYALSIHRLHAESGAYAEFLDRKPDVVIGYSIYIYRILPNDEAIGKKLPGPDLPPRTIPTSNLVRPNSALIYSAPHARTV